MCCHDRLLSECWCNCSRCSLGCSSLIGRPMTFSPPRLPGGVDETVDDKSVSSGGRGTYRRILRAIGFKTPEVHHRTLGAS